MRTPSLRRRAVLWSVGVLALLLLVVGVGVDLALGTVLRAEQRQRLEAVAALATSLTGLSDQSLADRLSIPGIKARITDAATGGEVVGVPGRPGPGGGRPPVPPTRVSSAATITDTGRGLTATVRLRAGTTLVLSTDSAPIDAVLGRFRGIMAIASIAAVALAAAVLPFVLGRAMRPLAALTAAARETAAGGRGRRLEPRDPGTDLGRAAAQFDAMLEELEGAERRAEQAAERLGQFLSDASHELRTPLAGVSAGAERLIRESLDPDARDSVEVGIVREARRAARLVDDLLLVSRLGELQVRPEPARLGGLLAEAAERARSRPGAPRIEVVGDDATVAVDRLRFEQVLANLLGNAAAAGATRVRLRTIVRPSTATATATATIRISDDGPGIPVDSREAVFERLVRLDPARSTAGAGLGLPIARGLVEKHGGTLTCVAPEPGDLPGAVLLLLLLAADRRADPPSPRVPSTVSHAGASGGRKLGVTQV